MKQAKELNFKTSVDFADKVKEVVKGKEIPDLKTPLFLGIEWVISRGADE